MRFRVGPLIFFPTDRGVMSSAATAERLSIMRPENTAGGIKATGRKRKIKKIAKYLKLKRSEDAALKQWLAFSD